MRKACILLLLTTLLALTSVVELPAQSLNELTGRVSLTGRRTKVHAGMHIVPDSMTLARQDSTAMAVLADSLRRLPADSLPYVGDSVRMLLPDTLRKSIFGTDSLAMARDSLVRDSIARTKEKEWKRTHKKNGELRNPYFSDSMSLRRVCWTSAVLPGFGQIYNKHYWKLPILYGLLGTSIGMFIYENNKYQPLKTRFNELTDQSLYRTEELNSVQSSMIRYNTARQLFLFSAIATYIYFLGDAAVCYSTSEVASVQKATTLSTICPGAGQIYNKSYWRFPIVVGGFATTIFCVDWNNRGYERFKKAYRLKYDYDQDPSKYPEGSPDEFKGRYSASFLKDLRNSYRRNRDLCIIITAGLYLLQIVDAHVDAHLRDYDISNNLNVSVSPMFDYAYNPLFQTNTGSFGMNITLTF